MRAAGGECQAEYYVQVSTTDLQLGRPETWLLGRGVAREQGLSSLPVADFYTLRCRAVGLF